MNSDTVDFERELASQPTVLSKSLVKPLLWQTHGTAFLVLVALAMATRKVKEFLPIIPGKLLGQTLLNYIWLFYIGVFAAEKKSKVLPVLKKYWWLVGVGLTLYAALPSQLGLPNYDLVRTILAFYLWLGFAYRFPVLNIVSYGIYIYHMTVVNAMIDLGEAGKMLDVLAALAISCALGYLSTISIGKINRKLKKRLI